MEEKIRGRKREVRLGRLPSARRIRKSLIRIYHCSEFFLATYLVDHINLPRIPSGLLHIKNLTYLALNDSNIVDVPAAIGNLTKLTSLSLRENIIEYIPQ